jgi:hypothetical protein
MPLQSSVYFEIQYTGIRYISNYQEYCVQQGRAMYLPPVLGEEKHFYKCEFSSGYYNEMTVQNCSLHLITSYMSESSHVNRIQ